MPVKFRNEEAVQERMTTALKIVQKAWKDAGCPEIYTAHSDETGKIALALLAGDIYNKLES